MWLPSIGSGISSGPWSKWKLDPSSSSDRSLAELEVNEDGAVPLMFTDFSDSRIEPWLLKTLKKRRMVCFDQYPARLHFEDDFYGADLLC